MADALKSFLTLAEAKRTASVADLAARAMARHCDRRVSKMEAETKRLRSAMKEARRLIGFMTNVKIAAAARVLKTALEK